jgi:hypothetical protein
MARIVRMAGIETKRPVRNFLFNVVLIEVPMSILIV